MFVTYGLLGMSICAVWLKTDPIKKLSGLPSWLILFIAALISGLMENYVTLVGIGVTGLLGAASYVVMRSESVQWQRIICGALTILMAVVLCMHKMPGFDNPVLIWNIKFSPDSIPYTQYLNFDKGMVGLILLLYCRRVSSLSEWKGMLKSIFPIASITIIAVLTVALAIGYVRPDFKLSWYTPVFLMTNLLFTCVAEETLFRGWIQEYLSRYLVEFRFGTWITIVISGLLFGVTHLAVGIPFVLLATIAGLGYAYAYHVSKRIEGTILVHFLVNALHFIAFSYPCLQHAR